jgi:beta-phosphoglucomutase-like phosphatase (HAD superfamily)
LPDSQQLQQAITGATQGVTGRTFATKADQIEAQRLLAFKLKDLQDISGTQLTEAEKQLEVANKQLESLDAILENARAQIDALRGVDNSILGLSAAMAGLASAIGAERAAAASVASSSPSNIFKSSTTGQTGLRLEGNTLYFPGGGSHSVAGPDGARLLRETYGLVPGFANGGMHSGGIRLVGERGPELEATGPARYYSASQTQSMLGGGVVEEIKGLREEVSMLRAEARATAVNTGRTQDIMKRVTRNGEYMIVATDGEALEVTP